MRFALLNAVLLVAAVQLPDPSTGVIDGKVAVLIWPRFGGELVEPVRCMAHMIPRTNLDAELVYPCGVWFLPPPDQYRIWIEQGDRISPLQNLLVYNGGPFRERGIGGVFDVVEGGRVRVSPDLPWSNEKQLRLLHLDSHLRLGTIGRAFERRVSAAKRLEPVLMPSGRVLALITDRQGNALAVSRPVTVPERETVSVRPQPPSRGSDVLVILDRVRTASKETPDDVVMTLQLENRSLAPDVFVSAADRFYGVWYAVDADRATLRITSSTNALPEEEVKLRRGSVATLRKTLKLLPNVKISVQAPEGALDGLERSIEIAGHGQRTVRTLPLSGDEALVEHLPAEPLRITLSIGPWRFLQEADLSRFEDAEVRFDLQPLIVTGTIYRGREPAAGTLKFFLNPEWVSATTDDGGRYQLTLWEPGFYVAEIELLNGRGPPFREFFIDIEQSQTRDFRVPDTHYVAHVTNADSGEPVAGAQVVVTSRFKIEDGREQTTAQGAISDQEGHATLPALRPGSVSLIVRAPGYLQSERIEVAVDDTGEPRSIPIVIREEQNGARLVVRAPNGTPSANAEIIAVPKELSDTIVWRSSTDADGSVDIPKRLNGTVLLVSHPTAASLARLWTGGDSDSPTTWQLSSPAPPLTVKVTDTTGRSIRFARVLLWVDGVALQASALRFLSGTAPVTDRDGYWRTAHLGGQRYEVLATRDPQAPVVASFAQPLPFPWPDDVTIRVVD